MRICCLEKVTARCIVLLMWTYLLLGQTRSFLFHTSPVPHLMAWNQDAFQHPLSDFSAYGPFPLLRQVLLRVMFLINLSLVLVAPFWPQKEWFSYVLALLAEEPLEHPLLWNLLVKPHIRKFHRGPRDAATSCMEDLRQLFCNTGFLKEVAAVVASDLRVSTTCPISESGLDSSIGVLEGVSLHSRPLSQVAEVFLYPQKKLKLSVPAGKFYRATLNHAFSLAGVGLAAS